MRVLGRETRLGDNGPHELLRPFRVDEARLPGTQDLGHFRRVDVLVNVFWVIRLEQLGELFASVLDEVVERLQASQYDQVPGEDLLAQIVTRNGRVNELYSC